MLNLEQIKKEYLEAASHFKKRIVVCAGTGCIANGSMKVFDSLKNAAAMHSLDVCVEFKPCDSNDHDILLSGSGCQGFCQVGPLVTIEPDGILYTHVKPADAEEIIEKTVMNGEMIERPLVS